MGFENIPGTDITYARRRVTTHLERFTSLYNQFLGKDSPRKWLEGIERLDNLFPDINCDYWV